MKERKQTYNFTLLLSGADPLTPENLNKLYEAGCDDATFGRRESLSYAEFDREANSLAEAVGTAIRDIEGAIPGLQAVRVEPEELVSPAAIATRTSRSRESVRQLMEGMRGPGHFPAAAMWVTSTRRLWRWSDVANWFVTYLDEELPNAQDAIFLGACNGALEVRWHLQRLSVQDDRLELTRFLRENLKLSPGQSPVESGRAEGPRSTRRTAKVSPARRR